MQHRSVSIAKKLLHRILVVLGAGGMTLTFFLVLPLIQAISKPPTADLILQRVDTVNLPPPPPPMEEEPEEEEPEEEEPPPELEEEAPPLDLSQLELALNPGFGEGWGADFKVELKTIGGGGDGDGGLFSAADLDQRPRALYQPSPVLTDRIRRKAPGEATVLFIVDQKGRVQNPIVQSSTDPVFDRPALATVKQWRFEPGKRNGQAVRFRMKVDVVFPKSQ